MKQNQIIKQVLTQDFPYRIEYTRLYKRHIEGKGTIYTVVIQNNVIQKNFVSLEEASKYYASITK
jgi:hypothetical protein